ncbi:hypothetical protein BO70DRAFT_360328 [Aspergillus heteromorphus CBS 117.55]|uniref:Hydrophobin n=1 Tax=Aspergillus heteromorphus CBS 117.55 TaxID=1448321 RepID=A0A317WRE6_9EURO|nr:uncharacterized protein BO70DRAFT_360328 [Aspergillus heteromorphus CBS 117.55]PWY87687.1 hypothetical protein BO70DRAFT_360328 [Aspergillus heteromorphus CBS 117.55]
MHSSCFSNNSPLLLLLLLLLLYLLQGASRPAERQTGWLAPMDVDYVCCLGYLVGGDDVA